MSRNTKSVFSHSTDHSNAEQKALDKRAQNQYPLDKNIDQSKVDLQNAVLDASQNLAYFHQQLAAFKDSDLKASYALHDLLTNLIQSMKKISEIQNKASLILQEVSKAEIKSGQH